MRADARRNREKVLAAAEELFDERGTRVQIEDIARRAGVGVGTVCRHFETKDALIGAVLDRYYRRLVEETRTALDGPDGGLAFREFVLSTSELAARHRGLAEQMKDSLDLAARTSDVRAELREGLTRLVERAQAAGTVRGDVGPADVAVLFAGIAQTATLAGEGESALRRRHVLILLDGLLPRHPSRLPGRPLGFADLESGVPGGAPHG